MSNIVLQKFSFGCLFILLQKKKKEKKGEKNKQTKKKHMRRMYHRELAVSQINAKLTQKFNRVANLTESTPEN